MKSPELAIKVYELLRKRRRENDVEYMDKWDDLLRKYKIQYIKVYFDENSATYKDLFNIMNSPTNNFIYVRDPYRSTGEHILKIPLKVATKMVVLGTLP
jgi:hypothetical protein